MTPTLNNIAIVVQVLLFVAVTIYVVDTFKLSGARSNTTPKVLPIVTWIIVLPIIVVCIAQSGEFAASAYPSFAISAQSAIERSAIQFFTFLMALLCLSVFILGFARCIYTVNLLDLDHWWAVDRFRSRCVTGWYGRFELLFRTLVAVAFGYHQTTILNFLACFSRTSEASPGIELLRSLSLFFQTALTYTALPGCRQASEDSKTVAVWLFCTSGAIVFVFMLAWTGTVYTSVRMTNASSNLNVKDKRNVKWQLLQQLVTSVAGIIVMGLLLFMYETREMPIIFIICLGLVTFILLVVILGVFVPNLWGVIKRGQRETPTVAATA